MHIILGIRVKYCTTIAETATPIQRRKSAAIHVSLRKEKDSGV